ncbi:MMPL family transporter [Streptomyces sp. NPDC090493]|uniref:MMPL family transporter n=1 Tax=Streptomyces sp. NPDC090493 TaxID=3365964 RepID=UPI0038242EEA
MATLLARLGRAAFRHRIKVLLGWLCVLVATAACYGAFHGQTDNRFTTPGSESQRALDSIRRSFPPASGVSAQVVFTAPRGRRVTEQDYVRAIDRSMSAAAKAPQVSAVISPVDAKLVSRDGTVALGQVKYAVERTGLKDGSVDALRKAVQPARSSGLKVLVGGTAVSDSSKSRHGGEAVGLVIALAVLTVTFGSLLAAGMPLLTALAGVATGALGLLALSGSFTISSTAPTLAAMLGLAVGIDYALFILSRHRAQLAGGMSPEDSAAAAVGSAGSAVVVAGLTVVIALAGLSVVGIPFLTVMGLGSAATVLISVLVAITLMPALLGLAGHRLTPKNDSRAERRERAAAAIDRGAAKPGLGERWGRLVTRRPLVTVLLTVGTLAVVAIPALSLNLALPDNSSASDEQARSTYGVVSHAFGPGANGPLLVLAETGQASTTQQAADRIAADLKELPDVAAVSTPTINPRAHSALLQVMPKSGPQDGTTKDLVTAIRDHEDSWQHETGAKTAVTGTTAVNIDVSQRLADSLLPFAVTVVGLSLVLLFLAFRSVVVPLKAAFGFLLSVAATFGAVVAVFQWGWLAGPLGVITTGPVVSVLPIILMAVLFGLAMDYEVFLVSRIHEAYTLGEEPVQAVHSGMRHAARVVTAAALIMLSVFAGFVPGANAIFKPIAFALAVGVLFDAFVIRMTFVPAFLALTRNAAWWLPRWLDRRMPHLHLEGDPGLPKQPRHDVEAPSPLPTP